MPGWSIAAVVSAFAALFVVFFVVVLRLLRRTGNATYVRVDATVVRLVRRVATESGDPDTFAPVYRFRAVDGREHEVEDYLSSAPARHVVGQRVAVAYPSGEPTKAAPPRRQLLVLVVVLVGVAAGVFVIAAAVGWLLVLT